MNENSSPTVKEISDDTITKNSSKLESKTESPKEKDLSFQQNEIPSADSSSSRRNNDSSNC